MSEHLEYDGIDSIEGLEAVRKRPGMYVGSTTCQDGRAPRALMQLFQEVLSNSVDEAMAGFGTVINVMVHNDGSLSVEDFGRGIPYGEDGDDAIRALTKLHSSGKFDSSAYRKSGGQHGIGLKAANALSEWLTLSVKRTDLSYSFRFVREDYELLHYDESEFDQTGTIVHFKPDATIFESVVWDLDVIREKLNSVSYLTPGVKYTFKNELDDSFVEYLHHDGLSDLVRDLAAEVSPIGYKDPVSFHSIYALDRLEDGSIRLGDEVDSDFTGLTLDVDVVLMYIEDFGETVLSFANGIPTTEGGPHVQGLRRGLLDAFSEFGSMKKLLKGSGKNGKLDARDVRDGLVCVVSVGIPESLAQFEGQVKEKLGTALAYDAVLKVMQSKFTPYIFDHEKETLRVFDKILDSKSVRELRASTAELKKIEREKKGSKSRLQLSDKLSLAISKNPEELELLIVEGDSAGGTAKAGRIPKFQAVLPLRGKPKNVLGMRLLDIYKNQEFLTLIETLGCGVKDNFNYAALKYHKIIIMTDADDDGMHIRNLLLAFFWTLMPDLLLNGNVYIANPPLYRFDRYRNGKRELVFALDQAEFEEKRVELADWTVTRLKGLGEMSPFDLKLTTMDPETRVLTKVVVNDPKKFTKTLSLFMGKDSDRAGVTAASLRRDWFQENVLFTQDDL